MIVFFKELKLNNNREWFEKNKEDYIQHVKEPSQVFLQSIGERLFSIRPYINVDPRRSIFRIYRDIRFSKDKTPYKSWLSMFFWEGAFPKNENSGLFISISSNQLSIGGGMYNMPKEVLTKFREQISGAQAEEFAKIITNLKKKGYEIRGKHYKRYPRDYSETDKNSEFLLYNSCFVMEKQDIPKCIYSYDIINYCIDKYMDWLELHSWLVNLSRDARKV
ncbi:DUF2461 domain-containing protein [Candidatus Peregrinibacteria bacterium]|jgi:uncharacterized protein (TIGR02453 family)|nr:DUF2461 domain-containing protein [Candidatus Peregrinibacteria bacterium]